MGIEIESLTKVYDRKITGLQDVSLSFESGVLGLLGPNGAGKTTLMRILATLLDSTQGRARVEGYDVARQPYEVRRILGYLPQTFGLYPQMTCREFLDYIGLLYGMSAVARRDAIDRTLSQVRLEEVANRRIRTLSGGMRQRLGIAQAVLSSPRLLIVDEPTVGLDPEERIRIRNLVSDLARERVVILSTHIVGDVSSTANRIALIKKGRLIFDGAPSELLREIEGRVWELTVEETALPALRSSGGLTNVTSTEEGLQARVLIESPGDLPGLISARQVSPGLEDAYLWKMGESAAGPVA